jgi:glycerol kinase
LRDGLGLITNSSDVETLAATVDDTEGVVVVPAFVGLGAPHWDPYARGAILGLTRGTQAGHLARAAVESMAFQTRDVLDAMAADAGMKLSALRVDGGASVNDTLMQFQADLLDAVVRRPVVSETTALGVAYLAGLAVGYWNDRQDIASNWALDREFVPQMESGERDRRYAIWQQAVQRACQWEPAN